MAPVKVEDTEPVSVESGPASPIGALTVPPWRPGFTGKTRVVDMPPSVASGLAQYFMEYHAGAADSPQRPQMLRPRILPRRVAGW